MSPCSLCDRVLLSGLEYLEFKNRTIKSVLEKKWPPVIENQKGYVYPIILKLPELIWKLKLKLLWADVVLGCFKLVASLHKSKIILIWWEKLPWVDNRIKNNQI